MDNRQKLEELKNHALADNNLPLKKGATNLVFGVGNPNAEILCIGEGPGYWEDTKAEPFVGNAGILLNKLLTSINIKRDEVYITNVVMHRPPENRDPSLDEILAYQKYVDGIIEIIKPKIILTLGRFSMAKFIPDVFISGVHGKPHKIIFNDHEITLIPMYHPAAALRNSQIMGKIKEDFLKIPDIINKLKEIDKVQEKSNHNDVEESKQIQLL